MLSIYGFIGFIGYETLKWYNRIWNREKIIPKSKIILYLFLLILLSLLCALLSAKLSPNSEIMQIFIGFSVPSNMKVIPELLKKDRIVNVDDINIQDNIDVDDSEICDNTETKFEKMKYYYNLLF